MNCLKCGKEPFGLVDKIYLETFKVCWNCDWLKWKEGKLSLEKFELREQIALKEARRGNKSINYWIYASPNKEKQNEKEYLIMANDYIIGKFNSLKGARLFVRDFNFEIKGSKYNV